jgi:chromosome segregation ATPase
MLIFIQEEIAQNNTRIEELEEHTRSLEDENANLEETLGKQKKQNELQSQEIDSLRNRANATQTSWVKERDDLISREAFAREEYEQARQAMQDWEVLAMEERAMRKTLEEKVTDLEEQLASFKEAHERAASERDSQSQTVDNLQRALREIQDGMFLPKYACG